MTKTMKIATLMALASLAMTAAAPDCALAQKTKKKKDKPAEDPYARYVWPPPPAEARIRLETILTGRADVEASSSFKKTLVGMTDTSPYDNFTKPFGIAIDSQDRIIVSDPGSGALMRFDPAEQRMDVLGTKAAVSVRKPMGVTIGEEDEIYVADVSVKAVLAFASDGQLNKVYGKPGDLDNPTGVTLSPDGTRVYVADSKAHRVVVFDQGSAEKVFDFGTKGAGEGEFYFPTTVEFSPDGELFVVDQLNARVQVLAEDGEYLDHLGQRGTGLGSFGRPKDIAIDDFGLIYVTDFETGFTQIFDTDFTLLTFIGGQGQRPGRFFGASGIDARGDRFAVVDQMNRRIQVFRYLESRGGE